MIEEAGKSLNKLEARTKETNSRYTWILDPGHGGIKDGVYQTQGKRSPVWADGTQYFEGEGNRDIARRVGHALFKLGIHFEYTVEPNDPTDVALDSRVEFVNHLNYKNKIGVSIHSNGASAESAEGWEIFTSKGHTKSDLIADIFAERFQAKFPDRKFRKDMSDGDFDKEANFYILKYSTCPFILLENFFHTNEYECKNILMKEEGRQKIAEAIVEAIVLIEDEGFE